MVTHYVYDEVDPKILCQGDVLTRTPELVECIREYFPYYADHKNYHYFMVITQTCDLTCRKPGDLPGTPYISIAAVRPVSDAIQLEAAKFMPEWQLKAKIANEKQRERLALFVARLIDNNEPGLFYLHTDPSVGLSQPYCAFLQLSITLRVVHFPKCLKAKGVQLKEPFQAKLGWLLGHMFSRVGTAEWNTFNPETKVSTAAGGMIKGQFVCIQDQQMKEGLTALGDLAGKDPEEIKKHILKTTVLPRSKKFEHRALEVLGTEVPVFSRIGTPVIGTLKKDDDLRIAIDQILTTANVPDENKEAVRNQLISAFVGRLDYFLREKNMPNKEDILKKLVTGILQDAGIATILK